MKRKNRKPRFLWQGVLILAPMLVLAKLGALAIWQDKRMAQHEADLRAQDLAEQISGRLASDWTIHHPSYSELIVTDSSGNLIAPKPIRFEQSAAEENLSAEQVTLFREARAAEFRGDDPRHAIALFQKLLATTPPSACAQQARYSLGLLFFSTGEGTNGAKVLRELLQDPSPAIGDAGGDLKTLALLKLALFSQVSFDLACSNAVANPTPLTPEILRTISNEHSPEAKNAAKRGWSAWQADELKRHVHAQLRQSFRTNPITLAGSPFRAGAFISPPAWRWITNLSESQNLNPISGGVPQQPRRGTAADKAPVKAALDTKVSFNRRASTDEWDVARLEFANRIRISGRIDNSRLIEQQFSTTKGPLAGAKSNVFTISKASEIADWISAQLEHLRLPQYFGVSVNMGDYDVIRPEDLPAVVASGGGKGSGRIWIETHRTNAPPALASASQLSADGLSFLARVHLIGPDLLYEQQNARSRWIAMVITGAALTCIVGFVSAYRAFHKQLRLAEMKSNFVSSVSHELRAPIASVRLMAEGLERGKISEPAKQREYFRFITQECRRLSSMIENVLDFARIEQGRKQYEFEPTDVRALVEQTVKLMEPYANERGVRLLSNFEGRVSNADVERGVWTAASPAHAANARTAESHSSSPWGEGPGEGDRCVANLDGAAIQQALVNLIDNAIKHSPSGEEVTIALSLNSQSSTLNISVSDLGPGIPPAEHEKIFERFYRLGSELHRETPGVGIGLSIVKHIVEAHGGRVRVESDIGKGSRLTIELPITAEAPQRREAL